MLRRVEFRDNEGRWIERRTYLSPGVARAVARWHNEHNDGVTAVVIDDGTPDED